MTLPSPWWERPIPGAAAADYALNNPVGRATLEAEYRAYGLDPAMLDEYAAAGVTAEQASKLNPLHIMPDDIHRLRTALTPPIVDAADVIGRHNIRWLNPHNDGDLWAMNNAHTREGAAHLREAVRAAKAQQAKEQKHFTVRRLPLDAATGMPWCIRDTGRPHYIGRAVSLEHALEKVDKLLAELAYFERAEGRARS